MASAAPRVAPIVFPERWDGPGRPDGASASIQDAFRQTQFQLGGDLRVLAEGMNLQLQVIKDSSPSTYRTLPLAAMAIYWSRAFLAMSEAAHAVSRAAYPVCPVLVRAACEAIAAGYQSGGEEQPLFREWLSEAMHPNEQHHALEVGLGHYFAGSTLVNNGPLGATYRAAAEFSRQHFGASLIEIAPESNRQRIAVTFADQTFHFGWAQLVLGWLLTLCAVQLTVALDAASPFHATLETRAATDDFLDRARRALETSGRCRVEEIMDEGSRRLIVANFRRQSSGAPVRILL
jgi:hypothetical protein